MTCRVCGYRAENLTSHVTTEHPALIGTYRETYPGAELGALRSPVRDKAAIRGVARSPAFRQKVSRGKTATLDAQVLTRFRLTQRREDLAG